MNKIQYGCLEMVRSDETVHTNRVCKTPKATKMLQISIQLREEKFPSSPRRIN